MRPFSIFQIRHGGMPDFSDNRRWDHFSTLRATRIASPSLSAHRLSTVRAANVIFAIENGEIVEEGSHDELIKRDGYYARLSRLQGGFHPSSVHQDALRKASAPDRVRPLYGTG
jgi:hypothetical protein